jgi:hypothetical protein
MTEFCLKMHKKYPIFDLKDIDFIYKLNSEIFDGDFLEKEVESYIRTSQKLGFKTLLNKEDAEYRREIEHVKDILNKFEKKYKDVMLPSPLDIAYHLKNNKTIEEIEKIEY